MKCPTCNALCSDTARFCPKCGTTLTQAASATTRPSYQQQAIPQPMPAAVRTGNPGNAYGSAPAYSAPATPTPAHVRSNTPVYAPTAAVNPSHTPVQPYVAAQTTKELTPTSHSSNMGSTSTTSRNSKAILVCLDVLITLLVAIVPWFGFTGQAAEVISGVLGKASWTLPDIGGYFMNTLAPMASNYGAMFGSPGTSQMGDQFRLVGGVIMAVCALNLAAGLYTIYIDVKGRKGLPIGSIVTLLTVAIVIVGVLVGFDKASMAVMGNDSLHGLGFQFLQPGVWLTLVASGAGIVLHSVYNK